MFSPGDVVGFESAEAGKHKFHLCISTSGHFVFINSPKPRSFPGDFLVKCADVPGIKPTPSGESIISITVVMQKTNGELRSAKARKVGNVSIHTLKALIAFIEHSPVVSDELKEELVEGLGDWV